VAALEYPLGRFGLMLGTHCLLELYGCDAERINDPEFLEQTLKTAADTSRATLIKTFVHKFEPQGVTGFALLGESHISLHSWPESGYVAADCYTCGDKAIPELACEYLAKQLKAKSSSISTFKRFSRDALSEKELVLVN
jgi:S-adenosylmethionine decarboxylase